MLYFFMVKIDKKKIKLDVYLQFYGSYTHFLKSLQY